MGAFMILAREKDSKEDDWEHVAPLSEDETKGEDETALYYRFHCYHKGEPLKRLRRDLYFFLANRMNDIDAEAGKSSVALQDTVVVHIDKLAAAFESVTGAKVSLDVSVWPQQAI